MNEIVTGEVGSAGVGTAATCEAALDAMALLAPLDVVGLVAATAALGLDAFGVVAQPPISITANTTVASMRLRFGLIFSSSFFPFRDDAAHLRSLPDGEKNLRATSQHLGGTNNVTSGWRRHSGVPSD
jgi:hypothetical protein